MRIGSARFPFFAALCTVLILWTGVSGAQAQEGDGLYQDPQGRFTFPLPSDWTNAGDDTLPHFVSPQGADLYIVTLEDGDDTAASIDAAVKAALPEVTGDPVQSSEAPLPGGVIWAQNVYLVDGGETLVVGVGRSEGGTVYTLIIRGSQAEIGGATPALNAAVLGFALTGEVSAGSALPDYADPESYTETEITLQVGEITLPGTLTMPVGADNVPGVVLVAGSGPNDRDETIGLLKPLRDLAIGLASRGIAVLRYDKRTFAYRSAPEQIGEITIDREVTEDAVAALELLAQTEGVDPTQVYVAGHSLGGMMAARIAAQSGQVAGVILLAAPARPFGEMIFDQLDYLESLQDSPTPTPDAGGGAAEATPEVAPEATDVELAEAATFMALRQAAEGLAAIAGGAAPEDAFPESPSAALYWGSVAAVDQTAEAQALALPFLVLQGERDYQVTMEDFARWQVALATNPEATFISYPDLNHVFMALGELGRMSVPADYNNVGFVAPDVVEDIAAWINGMQGG